MIISPSLTVGQITFVLRVTIQIFSYIGLFIVCILVLDYAPRVASLATHDTLNRIVGASSATTSTAKWIYSRFRRHNNDPTPPINLLLILLLSLFYTIFASFSDIGFLGFYACTVPGPSILDFPASVNSTEKAEALLSANLVNGTKPELLKAYYCDSTSVAHFKDAVRNSCTSWRNGTYSDFTFFSGLNSTDSAALMPRHLTYLEGQSSPTFDLNSMYTGPITKRVVKPTIARGLAIEPHETGVRVVVGVPQLGLNTRVELQKAMSIEVDVGCMDLGVYAQRSVWHTGTELGVEYFHTNGSWRAYTGPDYMERVLHKTVDDIRAYLLPFFDPSTVDSMGRIKIINDTNLELNAAASVSVHRLPLPSNLLVPDYEFLGNCTEAFQRQLGIPVPQDTFLQGDMCSLLGIGGSRSANGEPLQGYIRMVCAAATQVNMASATIRVDATGSVFLNISRLPSDLTYVNADYWRTLDDNGTIDSSYHIPYERYILSDNPKSPTTHFIRHRSRIHFDGQGTAGNVISFMGDIILDPKDGFIDKAFVGLTLLDEGFDYVDTGTDELAKWVGQVGGSYVLGSLAYNGWAALQATPITVFSTGGHIGSCYKPLFALGFVPLLLSAIVVMLWALLLLFQGSWSGNQIVKEVYGGLATYTAATCPGAPLKNTLVAWEASPHPHLRLISEGSPLVGDADDTAIKYLRLSTSYQ